MEPITTSAGLLLGAGWFANKILGPSADELGAQLKSFVGDRTRRLVKRAGDKADPEKALPLSPAFFYNFSQKAAFSDDSEEINEMWASLLADASEGQSYRHSLFADILTRIGSHEAKFLVDFCEDKDLSNDNLRERRDVKRIIQSRISLPNQKDLSRTEIGRRLEDSIRTLDFKWPVRIENAHLYFNAPNKGGGSAGITTISNDDDLQFAVEVLKREDLIESFEFEMKYNWGNGRFDGYRLTLVGAAFFRACHR